MDGNRGKPDCLCTVLYIACLGSVHGCTGQTGDAAFVPYLPCVGLWQRGDFRRDVHPHVSVAYGFRPAVYGFASAGGKKAGLSCSSLFAAGVPYGILRIFNTVLLYYIPLFPGGRVLFLAVKKQEDEGAYLLWGSLRAGILRGGCVLSGKYVPYFQGIPGNGGGQ